MKIEKVKLEKAQNQPSPSDTWEIDHNLDKHVSVRVIDSSEQLVEGEVTYNSLNKVTIKLNGSFTGWVEQNEQLPQKSEHCVSISLEPCKYKGACKKCS